MTVLVAIDGWQPADWRQALAAAMPGRTILSTRPDGTYAGADADLEDVRYVVTWKPRQSLLDRLPRLEVLFSLGAGVDHILALERLPPVPVVRIVDPDLTARMTEYVVWQVLHHHRRGPAYARQQAARQWRDLKQPAAREVAVGILGLGVLGHDAAEVLRRIGFRVLGWSRTAKTVAGVETFHGEAGLAPFLAQTDILVSLLPLTPRTRGILDRDLIGRLRRDGPLGAPVLINAGRGGSQNQADIDAALRSGALAGASLDVFEREPLTPESPLWDAPNLTVTPHVASVSDPHALAPGIADQIRAYESGAGLRNVVDPARGY